MNPLFYTLIGWYPVLWALLYFVAWCAHFEKDQRYSDAMTNRAVACEDLHDFLIWPRVIAGYLVGAVSSLIYLLVSLIWSPL